MGVISTKKSLAKREKLSVSSFYRRRLAYILVNLKFLEHLKEAVTYIEQGNVCVGPDAATDPAFLVMRNMEDFITWVDSSRIKRRVDAYNERLDDCDAMTVTLEHVIQQTRSGYFSQERFMFWPEKQSSCYKLASVSAVLVTELELNSTNLSMTEK